MRLILFITLPATVGLILLTRPIIEVLFEGGEFNAQSTALTAWALDVFCGGAVRVFDDQDHRSGILCPARHVDAGGHWILLPAGQYRAAISFSFDGCRNGGPPLATSVAAFFDTIALMIALPAGVTALLACVRWGDRA